MNKLIAHFFLWVFVLLGVYTRGFAGGWMYLIGLLTIALFTPSHIVLHLSYTKVADKLKGLDVVLIGLSHLLFWSVFLFQYDFADDGDIIMVELFTGKVEGLTPQLAHTFNIIAMVAYPLVSLWLLKRRRKFSVSFPGIQRKLFQGYLILFLLVPAIGVHGYVLFSLAQEQRMDDDRGYYEDLDRALRNAEEVNTLRLDPGEDPLFPKEIFELPELEYLWLGGGQIKEIPAEIGQLRKLKSLNLTNNKLTSLPDAIGELRQLKSLNLEQNYLKSVSSEICKCKQLEELRLAGTFTSIPPCLLELPELKQLMLQTPHNEILKASIPNYSWHDALYFQDYPSYKEGF